MSTLRITNIEAKADPSSPTVDEKVKIKSSGGDTLLEVDGASSGITTVSVGIGVTLSSSGIVSATSFSGNIIGDVVTVGSGVTNYAGILSARELYGDGSKLTGIDSSVLKDNITNSTRVASNPAGVEITGIATATSFVGDGANITAIPTTGDINALQQSIAMLGFYRATDNSKAKYTLVDQVIDEYVDASGIDASASTNEATTAGYYYGVSGGNATGGTETTPVSYTHLTLPTILLV